LVREIVLFGPRLVSSESISCSRRHGTSRPDYHGSFGYYSSLIVLLVSFRKKCFEDGLGKEKCSVLTWGDNVSSDKRFNCATVKRGIHRQCRIPVHKRRERGNQETSCVDKQVEDEPHCLGAELFFSRVGHPTCASKVLYLTRCSNVFGRMQTSTYGFSITKPRKDDFKNCAKTLKFSVMM
jgi:hypothetical protein